MSTDTQSEVTILHLTDATDGPGWYWYHTEYPDEGMCGPFASQHAAQHAAQLDAQEADG